MSSVRILIVEDDADHGRSLQEAISDLGYEVEVAATGEAGIEAFRARGADVVLTDLVLPDVDGIAVMQRIRALGAAPVILMTAYASIDTSVRAIREGAYDYLQKPLDIDELQTKLERALEAARLRRQVEQLSAEVRGKWSAHGWVAESPVMREVVRQTLALADTNATVLIRGASGTGKELVARALHADGPRANGPFVAVNCAAFAESLLESELFGHEKGSFTGAVTRRAGAFERAEGGTLFLDEIGDAPPAVQVKLLRVLEDREIMRVGGQKSFRVDVRLVSATNRDLDERVASGKFRQDLLYRLAVVSIVLPPLRERREDIRPLAERFIAQAQKEHGRRIRAVEPEWFARLEAYDWPGNIRELRNTIEAAVVTAPDEVLQAERLALGGVAPAAAPGAPKGALTIPAGATFAEIEKKVLGDVLRRHEGNRSLTAAELGLSRRTIQRKIQEYDLPY
ncbi:MAG: sigma-54 dependent transcriptional regulator [Kiritimatiellia bacterium]|jgi:DNA-binding NtrC family response regulator|nr:sigma-54-dependent Fis family transcriptional regulator [Lentisphaerota bacterium]